MLLSFVFTFSESFVSIRFEIHTTLIWCQQNSSLDEKSKQRPMAWWPSKTSTRGKPISASLARKRYRRMNDDDYDYDDETASSADMSSPAITLLWVSALIARRSMKLSSE
ncbi:hypothetical protein AVEN_241843-1 [Araneus ventricosus]|uniref:Uncharacterized protein n=1 Tax=Araneus ventricosus TaxID=182803 RepID=A0A4Y2GAQ3_ARAVE|nr:hypothetical protein AVEN_241843-1 [Araneus ventricosus]